MSDPFHHGRPARPGEFGQGYSGSAKVVGLAGASIQPVELAEIVPSGYQGLAAVHIHVQDVSAKPTTYSPVANSVLIGELTWGSGLGGGVELIDLTRGHIVLVGATSHVSLDLSFKSSVDGAPLVLWRTKQVKLTVNWYGSATSNAKYASPSISLTGAATSAFVQIPLQAKSMMVDTNTPTGLASLIAEFSTSDDPAGTGIKYRTLDPNHNGTIIHSGVEYVRYVSTVTMSVIPVWALW